MSLKNIVVLYHADCLDGFGSAFSAWKKFGESASYIPVRHQEPPPKDLAGKEIYIIDFSYPKETLLAVEKAAKRLIVLDHHEGIEEATRAIREHVFDNDRSGSGIAWDYFHGAPRPKFISYIEDGDLWRFALPRAKDIGAFLSTVPFEFGAFDTLARELDDDALFATYADKGASYAEYIRYGCEQIAKDAEEVIFEGYRVLAVNGPHLFHSALGHALAKKHPPFGIVWYHYHGLWKISLRGDGTVNLAELAKRYGGGGHHNAAGIRIPADKPFPWKRI
jgi:oligoribonuclease NrnB/cAMP/cGMP phosphodiesterase (DHH superfamily)